MKSHRASPEDWCCSSFSSGLKMRRLQSSSCSECQSIWCKVMYFSKLFSLHWHKCSVVANWVAYCNKVPWKILLKFWNSAGLQSDREKATPCSWYTWVTSCTTHPEASLKIVSVNLRNITLLQFCHHGHAANFKSLCEPPPRTPLVLKVLHLPLHALLRQWYVLF